MDVPPVTHARLAGRWAAHWCHMDGWYHMQQDPLFVGAPEAVHLMATYVHGEGWHLSFGMRRQYEEWGDVRRAVYSHLSTLEAIDVICNEVSDLL